MNDIRKKMAGELLRMAKGLLAVSPKEVLDELDYLQVTMAESALSRLKGKKFNSPKALEKAIEMFDRPEDGGYDKVFVTIHLNDGDVLKSFRYDHSPKDKKFTDQLNSYIQKNVKNASESKGRVAASSILDSFISQQEVAKLRRSVDDEITYKLAVDVYKELRDIMELSRSQNEALRRLKFAVNTTDMSAAKNNIFKAANELGMKLPHMGF